MNKKILVAIAIAAPALVLGFLGYHLARIGASWFGPEAMMIGATVVATIALMMLIGQYFAGTADYFLSVDNPRPLDDNLVTITSLGWGFFSQSGRSRTEKLTGQGFADVRFFAERGQVLLSLASCGLVRRVRISWRGNAGQHPLGQA